MRVIGLVAMATFGISAQAQAATMRATLTWEAEAIVETYTFIPTIPNSSTISTTSLGNKPVKATIDYNATSGIIKPLKATVSIGDYSMSHIYRGADHYPNNTDGDFNFDIQRTIAVEGVPGHGGNVWEISKFKTSVFSPDSNYTPPSTGIDWYDGSFIQNLGVVVSEPYYDNTIYENLFGTWGDGCTPDDNIYKECYDAAIDTMPVSGEVFISGFANALLVYDLIAGPTYVTVSISSSLMRQGLHIPTVHLEIERLDQPPAPVPLPAAAPLLLTGGAVLAGFRLRTHGRNRS